MDALKLFDQSPFFGKDNNQTGLNATGYVYVPTTCRSDVNKCSLHVSLHGCGVDHYYDEAVHILSFNRWAETNNMVILWPRLRSHGGEHGTAQQKSGCYDSYGQTGASYDTKNGVQMVAIRTMIEQLSGVRMGMQADVITV